MTKFWFIRHGESESNAGLPSESDKGTPLTDKGTTQAKHIADAINHPPDLFVVSSYKRAIQTAEPTLAKFPETIVKTWPIHEFSYLSFNQYHKTDSRQRGNLSRSYFQKADPDLILGEGGESFNHFIGRIETCINQIRNSNDDLIMLFSHGWFMRALLWYLYQSHPDKQWKNRFLKDIQAILPSKQLIFSIYKIFEKLNLKKMFAFLIFSSAVQIPNGSIIKFQTNHEENIELIDFELSHMPAHLIETTWINR